MARESLSLFPKKGKRAMSLESSQQIKTLLENGEVEAAVHLAGTVHPAELAEVLAWSSPLRITLIDQMQPEAVGPALEFLEPLHREHVLVGVETARIAAILTTAADDVATDVVQMLPAAVARQVVEAMPDPQREAISELWAFPRDTAGGRMTRRKICLRPDRTVGEALEYLRRCDLDKIGAYYVYVVDHADHLDGVINLRALVTASRSAPLHQVIERPVVSVNAGTDQEEAARLLKHYNLLALPVVDDEDRVLGMVTHDDLIDVLEDEATEDMFRMVGVDENEDLGRVGRSVRFRLPWLCVNLLTVFLAAFIVSRFELTLTRVAVLAVFLPVVSALGGNAGIQTVTVVIRFMALRRIDLQDATRLVWHEVLAGSLIGIVLGLAVGAVALVWRGNAWLGLVIAVAILSNVLIGVVSGVLIPLGLRRFRLDPAHSAGIWVTATTDALGFLVFLSLASWLVVWLG
jgi:magnesium transporter